MISQNAEQKQPALIDSENPANRFSYTRYDALGRIYEVGEKIGAASVTESDTRDNAFLQNWLNVAVNRQVTVTAYDEAPAWAPASLIGMQHNLRKRVSATALLALGVYPVSPAITRLAASYFSYDIAGNVSRQVQENAALTAIESQYISGGTGLKDIKYEYDLVSGKVNRVLYQDGKWDQFYYRYLYDGDNRVVSALSSRNNYPDANLWTTEATYRYYLHGPLARMELGKNKVQGVDYAYTLQGWLKGVNSQTLDINKDMSGDGKEGSPFQDHARDVYGFALGYYDSDYAPAGGTNAPAFGLLYQAPVFDPLGNNRSFESGKGLFNGNIRNSAYFIKPLDNATTRGYTYRYDQLNRLTATNAHSITGDAGWSNSNIMDGYKEAISYDANGNIKTYFRNGAGSGSNALQMDNLVYGYSVDYNGRLVNNKLRHVKDGVPASNYDAAVSGSIADMDDQPDDNYRYDKTGNLTGDNAENIGRINWTVYGKIASIAKGSTTINYGYDAGGNRIYKGVSGAGNTYYVRDAQGNVLGVYTSAPDGYHWKEQHLFGSSRLGMVVPGFTIAAGQPLGSENYNAVNDPVNNGIEGLRNYELSNHLGNVLATITDKKTGVDANTDGTVDYYNANIVTATDYYPFGMVQPGRSYNSGAYRYGFNGKEQDSEISGEGNQYDYGFRIYNPRIGRFLSTDPLFKSYPELTPYQFASNSPIEAIDLDGLEAESSKKEGFMKSFGKSVLRGIDNTISYIANNPSHAGYGYSPTMKPSTQSDIKRYEVNWSQLLDPTWHIQTFSENLVYGTSNFVGGIMEGDGARTAQAIPPLLGSVGTIAGVRTLTASKPLTVPKGIALADKIDIRRSFAQSFYRRVGGNVRDASGIDLTRSVSEVGLNSKTKLYQWTINGKLGDHFTTSSSAKNLGLPQMSDGTPAYFDRITNTLRPRTLVEVTLPSNVELKGLRSTANNIEPWDGASGINKGGDVQIYSPQVKSSNPKITPVQ